MNDFGNPTSIRAFCVCFFIHLLTDSCTKGAKAYEVGVNGLRSLPPPPPDSLRYQSFLAEGPEQEIIYSFEHQMTVILVEGELTSQMCVKYGGKHIDASPL